ncbi:MAG TPA: vitamin B12 dependent-methionine synthase activation domain-containing protein [Candidatus Acidoferrales bacterium]|nr:vitamin B12 dependent-methionine synthase activation domain-containing protein [Candidatus Acidoferrales bacterium]
MAKTFASAETFSFDHDEIRISRNAFACALGYDPDSMPAPLIESIDDILENGNTLCNIEGGYKIIGPVQFDRVSHSLMLSSYSFNVKKVVFQQLKKAENIALFACTAGNEIIEKSRDLMKGGELLKGYVYDVFGSLVVEEAMDHIQNALRNKMLEEKLKITNRYSPGYCGWDVSEQKKLFSMLPKKFCGIELTDSCLMRPIKSVSGIIGIGKSVKFNEYTCNLCDEADCLYRNLRHKTALSS